MPTRTTHNPVIEVLWTVVPVLILVLIAIPSFKLMYYMDRVPDAEMTIKVTGHQWYWQYEYPDQGNIGFNSNLVADNELKPEQPRLLEVDNPLVVPVGTNIRVQVAGTDVIHSWFVPSFGFQEYAVVGRLNEAWVQRRAGRHLLRRVQPDLRRQPRLHADRGQGRLQGRFRQMARRRQEEFQRRQPAGR